MSANSKVVNEIIGRFPMYSNVEEYLTLGEIGIEDELAVELQKELEREFNIEIGINFIKTIDVKMLKDYGEGRVDYIREYLQELRKAVDALDKYKFIIPSEPTTRLNGVRIGKPIYIMPPPEITFSGYEELAKRFDRPVIGINWSKDMRKIDTYKEYVKYVYGLMTNLEPNNKVDVVGHMDGKEAASKLELRGLINKAVVIDIGVDRRFKKEVPSDESLTEIVFGFLSYRFPLTFQNRVVRAIKNEPDLNSKISKMVSEIKEIAGKGMIATDLEEIIQILITRLKFNTKYRYKKISWIPQYFKSKKDKIDKKLLKSLSGQLFIKSFPMEANENPDILNEIFTIEVLNDEYSIASKLIVDKIIESFK